MPPLHWLEMMADVAITKENQSSDSTEGSLVYIRVKLQCVQEHLEGLRWEGRGGGSYLDYSPARCSQTYSNTCMCFQPAYSIHRSYTAGHHTGD